MWKIFIAFLSFNIIAYKVARFKNAGKSLLVNLYIYRKLLLFL